MEIGRWRKATLVYQEEKEVLAAKRDRAANLQEVLDSYSARKGYHQPRPRPPPPPPPGIILTASQYSAKLCERGRPGGDAGGVRGILYRANRRRTRALLHALPY